MLSRLLHIGVDKRLERATAAMGELQTLRSRMVEIELSLEARADAERVLLRRLTDCHVSLELTRQRLQDERDRADAADARATECIEALAAAERRLAEVMSGRARLHGELEQEHALRVIAEQALQTHQARGAELEERLRTLTEAVELAVSTVSKRLAARRDTYEQVVASLLRLAQRLNPLLELAATPAPRAAAARAPARADEHLRFSMAGSGYELTVAAGPPPRTNAIVNGAELGSSVVMKLGPSPLPGDGRLCAYLLPFAVSSGEQP
jgi:chromosome segregation ATPase